MRRPRVLAPQRGNGRLGAGAVGHGLHAADEAAFLDDEFAVRWRSQGMACRQGMARSRGIGCRAHRARSLRRRMAMPLPPPPRCGPPPSPATPTSPPPPRNQRPPGARSIGRRPGRNMTDPVDVSFFARAAKPLTSYRPYWAKRFGTAAFLPMSRAEMEQLGWDCCDVILVTGDAYVDHPSFGMAVIGRTLE